jgi:hypothetical protein
MTFLLEPIFSKLQGKQELNSVDLLENQWLSMCGWFDTAICCKQLLPKISLNERHHPPFSIAA